MPNKTVNYNLKKPLSNENYNIQDQNDNMDTIDSALKGLDTKFEDIEVPVTSVNNKTGAIVLDADDVGAETPAGAQSKVDALAGEGNTKTVKQLDAALLSHEAENAAIFKVVEKFALASVAGQAITVNIANGKELADRDFLWVEIADDITGGAITVNYNSAGALALKDIDGNAVTELKKGLHQFQYRTGVPIFFVLAPKGGASIKSIQRGILTMDATTKNIPISSIDPTESILKMSVKGSSSNAGVSVSGKITSATNLEFQTYNASSQTVSWEVIEFENVKSLQTGTITGVDAYTSGYNVSVSSVDTTKSALFFSYRLNASSTLGYLGYSCRGDIISSISIQFNSTTSSTSVVIEWSLIEFK